MFRELVALLTTCYNVDWLQCRLEVVGDNVEQARRLTYHHIPQETLRKIMFVMASCTFKNKGEMAEYQKCRGHKTGAIVVQADIMAARWSAGRCRNLPKDRG